ncbi:hypothetical protein SEA_MEDIUMFRY_76 [Arthrobacter phage MediumFry]|nr:hypothetical protein SEA_CATERPILLAR_76 [Arthrobacter phage Caterpillar]AXH44620.1 hypothetical protein SEA_MEDIUMFRY_76 [Arthrobacter phage MediumFry]
MSNTVHIVFGNAWHAKSYARAKAVNPRLVVNATHPELIQSKMTNDVQTIKVIRYPEEVWKPTTFPCEKRVAETERIIKGYQRLGVTVIEETE